MTTLSILVVMSRDVYAERSVSIVMLSIIDLCHNAECHYAKCHYAECHYAECHYAMSLCLFSLY
jgi:hypothetical protein